MAQSVNDHEEHKPEEEQDNQSGNNSPDHHDHQSEGSTGDVEENKADQYIQRSVELFVVAGNSLYSNFNYLNEKQTQVST